MARLAESSVVIALRDWQWATGRISKSAIGMFISLSGNADKKFGDFKLGLKDRFYLFEAKSTSDSVYEEWHRPIEKGRKHAHCMLRRLIERLADNSQREEARKLAGLSLRAHHFLYADLTGTRPALRIEPYLLGTLRRGGFAENALQEPERRRAEKDGLRRGLSALKVIRAALRSKVQPDPAMVMFDPVDEWTPAQFFGYSASLIGPKAARPVGVTLEELDAYIQYLCDGRDEEVNAIVATANGSFFCFSGSTSELRALVNELRVHLAARPTAVTKPRAPP